MSLTSATSYILAKYQLDYFASVKLLSKNFVYLEKGGVSPNDYRSSGRSGQMITMF